MKQYFRNFISIIIVTMLLCSAITYAKIDDQTIILSKINEYYSMQLEVLQDKDLKKLVYLDKFMDSSSKSGKQLLEYHKDVSEYIIYSHSLDNTSIDDYTVSVEMVKSQISKDSAVVYVNVNEEIKYNFMDDIYTDVNQHELSLKKINGTWLIMSDVYDSEFYMAYPLDTDFDILIAALEDTYMRVQDSMYSDLKADQTVLSIATTKSYDSYTSIERYAAALYALTWSENTGDYTTDSYNNTKFKNFYQQDCQNFVSQCIWYGMGGRSSVDFDYPMESDWKCNLSTSVINWTYVPSFYNWITGSASNRVYGAAYTSPAPIEKGDYIYLPGHVLFVNKVIDSDGDGLTDYDEIYICAHTKNRKDKNLKALYGGTVPPANMEFMRIYGKFN